MLHHWTNPDGFILAQKLKVASGIMYSGVETCSDLTISFAESCDSFCDMDCTGFIPFQHIHELLQMQKERSKEFRLLYCSICNAEKETSNIERSVGCNVPTTFLGYDYAWPCGEFYSSILNDVVLRSTDLRKTFFNSLNQYGLFWDYNTVRTYANRRDTLYRASVANGDRITYEGGCFEVIAIYQM